MSYLFLDTCHFITVGLLDRDFGWKKLIKTNNKKSSKEIHSIIDGLLREFSIEIKSLKGLILINGPGSYTGIRVGEGVAQIFEWQKISVFSTYHFEIPQLVGISSGTWVCNAFKNEIFVYKWNEKDGIKSLIDKEKIADDLKSDDQLYTQYKNEKVLDLVFKNDSSTLIEDFSNTLFNKIVKEKIRKEPFYFRRLEEEFRPSL